VILVDTSVWIELLNGRLGSPIAPDTLSQFVTGPPVVQGVLQGLRETPDQRWHKDLDFTQFARFTSLVTLEAPWPCDETASRRYTPMIRRSYRRPRMVCSPFRK
jgi:hypothetical protein